MIRLGLKILREQMESVCKLIIIVKRRMMGHLVKVRYFSFTYMVWSMVWEIALHIKRLNRMAIWAENAKERYIEKYIYRNYATIIDRYKNGYFEDLEAVTNYPIWVYWHQGLDFTPPLVLSSVNQLKGQNTNLIFLDKESLSRYITLPVWVEEKRERNMIGLAHYADIVRVSLLAAYGGIWIDATSWCNEPIPERIKSISFYTRKGGYNANMPLFAKGRWTSWCLGTNKIGYPLFCFIRDMFYEYAKREECWIDYLLLDKLISIGLKEIPKVQNDYNDLFKFRK